MTKPNNEPAFPVFHQYESHRHPGMTLRDWFAGQALANAALFSTGDSRQMMTARAYEIADAMLAEREPHP